MTASICIDWQLGWVVLHYSSLQRRHVELTLCHEVQHSLWRPAGSTYCLLPLFLCAVFCATGLAASHTQRMTQTERTGSFTFGCCAMTWWGLCVMQRRLSGSLEEWQGSKATRCAHRLPQ
jgi:hypothetical protein